MRRKKPDQMRFACCNCFGASGSVLLQDGTQNNACGHNSENNQATAGTKSPGQGSPAMRSASSLRSMASSRSSVLSFVRAAARRSSTCETDKAEMIQCNLKVENA